MKWTTEKPTRIGLYYARFAGGTSQFYVRVGGTHPFFSFDAFHWDMSPTNEIQPWQDLEWAGPIPEPEAA